MALTIPEALKRVQNPMTQMILRSVATTSELGALISIESSSGNGLILDREGLLPTTEFIDDAGATTEESTGADDVPIVQFRRIVGNMDIDGLAQAATPTTTNRQLAKKAKATWRTMKDKLINGGHTTGSDIVASFTGITAVVNYGPWLDSSRRGPGNIKVDMISTGAEADIYFRAPGERSYGPAVNVTADGNYTVKGFSESYYVTVTVDIDAVTADEEALVNFTSTNDEFDGMWELAHPSMVIPVASAGTGDDFDFSMMDALIDIQKIREGRAFLMPGSLVNKFFAEHRGLGGVDPTHMDVPGYSGPVPSYRGIPVLTEDNIGSYVEGSDNVSDIALVSLNSDEGLVLAAQSTGGEVAALSPDADPRTRSVFGFRIENLGPLEGKDAVRTRVKWYGAPALKSYLALAVRQGINND